MTLNKNPRCKTCKRRNKHKKLMIWVIKSKNYKLSQRMGKKKPQKPQKIAMELFSAKKGLNHQFKTCNKKN